MDLLLIEGVPGSGKSTLAEKLCRKAQLNGISASWYLEESKDHPVHPHEGVRSPALSERYLQAWENFISTNRSLDHLFIIEGSLFQSTVRFILQENGEALIPSYFSACQSLFAGVSVKLIYLRPPDIASHMAWTMEHRGAEWSAKVTGYLEKTAFCSNRGWQGAGCMKNFWSYYADLCDALVVKTTIPSHTIYCASGCFEHPLSEALDYVHLEQGFNTSSKQRPDSTPDVLVKK